MSDLLNLLSSDLDLERAALDVLALLQHGDVVSARAAGDVAHQEPALAHTLVVERDDQMTSVLLQAALPDKTVSGAVLDNLGQEKL